MGIMTFIWHLKIKSWEKEHNAEETEILKYPTIKNHIEFEVSRDKEKVFVTEDEELIKENPSTSSATISTSVISGYSENTIYSNFAGLYFVFF